MENRFIKACRTGNLSEVDRLLQDPNLNVHAMDEKAFRQACYNDHLHVVNRLLELEGEREIDVHVSWEKAFRSACKNGCLDVVNRLLELEGERTINVHDYSWEASAFKVSCFNGHLPVVNRLLELKGYREITPTDIQDSMHFACRECHLDVINRLLELEGKRFVKLSENFLRGWITDDIKILIIKVLLKKMKRLKLLDKLLKQKVDTIERKELVMTDIKTMPGGQDYFLAESSFNNTKINY